ncbi:MAG: hypothetical protein ACKOOG_01475 [Actinomycetota bacterium]
MTATATTPTPAPPRRLRRRLGAACIAVSCVLAPLALVANYAKQELLNTDRYVKTVSPLARNEAIRAYVATGITDRLMSKVDVADLAEKALPSRADFLAGSIATGVRTFVYEATYRALSTKQFAEIWDAANRTAHKEVKKALTGEGKSVTLDNGKIVLNLDQALIAVRTELSKRGLDIFNKLPIGDLAIKYELFDAKGLESARTAVRLLVVARLALLIGFFLLAALGIWLSGNRRRTVARWGFGVALATGVVAGLIGFLAAYSVDNVPANGPPPDAAEALTDAGLYFLRLSFRATIALGLVVALVATLAGPGRVAVRTRAIVRAALSRTPAPEPRAAGQRSRP